MAEKISSSKTLFASFLMFLAAFIWGTAFVAQSKGLEQIQNLTFLALRSYLAVIVLTPVSLFVYFKNKKKYGNGEHNEYKKFFSKPLFIGGILCGTFVCIASLVQQYGIILSGVSKSGFLTTLYILIVPILGIFLKKKIKVTTWISVAIALVGMYFLCMTAGNFSISKGDLFLILCAFLFSVQILFVDHFVEKVEPVRLSLMQFAVSAVISTVGAVLFETIDINAIKEAWFSIFYAGVLSSGVAFTLQVVSQKNLNPTVASLIMSLESVFAALSGAVFGERLTGRETLGCILVFSAVILAQIPIEAFFKKIKADKKAD
ncbi:MAG: DMT family transporter [Acutalibacteraceae bacterium]